MPPVTARSFRSFSHLCYNRFMVGEDVFGHIELSVDDVALLKELAADLPVASDVCRSDLLLYCREGPDRAIIVGQAMPHSVVPVYEESRVGLRVDLDQQAEVHSGLSGKLHTAAMRTIDVRGASIARQILPVRNARGKLIAVVAMDAYWLAYERHRRRSKVFQDALRQFMAAFLRGEVRGARGLTPFGERDGVMYVRADRHIGYMSGIAQSLYRRLGYRDSLVGRRVTELDTVDHEMVTQVLNEGRCLERQDEQDGLTWIRRALPVIGSSVTLWRSIGRRLYPGRALPARARGVFILFHDATQALQAQLELESKMAMLREVHHRVKNNLQVVASLMRLQARRALGEEAKAVLKESVNRILSVAVVHEFLSSDAGGTINVREVARRIVGQLQQGLIDPSKQMRLTVSGPAIWLPAERATQCALVVNELVQNAIQHGIGERRRGEVVVEFIDHGDSVSIIVADDGQGLPEGFELESDSNLGLSIVKSMVERDLKGEFELQSAGGTRAIVRFDKPTVGGM